jgi:acyl-CoA reductase-like NAD-dependent aldehyde dehydrogenase
MNHEMPVRNPRTGLNDYVIHPLTESGVAELAENLRQAQKSWVSSGPAHRCEVVKAWAHALLADSDSVVNALATDTGRYLVSVVEVQSLASIVDRWCDMAPELLSDCGERPSATDGVDVRNQLIPYGLIGVISPWNFPFLLSMLDSIPALIAGCAVLVKPSEVTPRFIEPLQRSLAATPELAGVFQWLVGDGITGAAMIENVDAIAFTGSVATGRIVGEACARNFIPSFLELGGKDPAIILPSADLNLAARIVLRASVQATGQACQSLERIYVHRDQYETFVDTLVPMAEKVELNYPEMHRGHIGPLIFDKQAEIISDHLEDAVAKGAKIRCGGSIETHGGGKWIRPTVVTDVDHSMKLMTEETFGPVIPIMAYNSVDEAVALANDTKYGLSAAVIGADIEEADAVGRRINAGAVSINDGGLTTEVFDAEHDSFRFSGMGAARMGSSGITRFMRQKALLIRHKEAKGIESLDEGLIGA